MIYLPEDYYFENNQDFPFKKGILITVKAIIKWCDSYEARIIEPKKGVKVRYRSGHLPKNNDDKEKLVENVLNWIWDNSKSERHFRLYLRKNEMLDVFAYHDDSFWGLELSEKEFIEFQRKLTGQNLPEDLFFNKKRTITAIPKHYEKWSKLRRILFGGNHPFSPKVWEEMKKQGQDQNYIIQKTKK